VGSRNNDNSNNSSNSWDLFRNIKDGNLNVNINRQDTVAFCLTIIFIAMTIFIGVGSGVICYKLGGQSEKVGQLEDCVFNKKCIYKGD
jgi:hypothetical protein